MNQPMREMPKYKSHKIVHALKIHNIDLDVASGNAMITPAEQGYAPFVVEAEYMGKHKPRIGGYYVVYDDGYQSWSPADAFEKGYTLVSNEQSAADAPKIVREKEKFLSVLESGDPIKDFYDEDDLASAVVYLLSSPLSQLKAALKNCDDFAWTWHCNLACIGLDAGGTHEVANRRAAQFMKNAFGIDVTKCENWKQFELQWTEESSEDDGEPTLEVWMSDWEAAVESGQSRISREEAERRYDAKYGRNRQQNDDY